MLRTTTPRFFAIAQKLDRWWPVVALSATLVLLYPALNSLGAVTGIDASFSIAAYLVLLVSGSGLALVYLGVYVSLMARGLTTVPRRPWVVDCVGRTIVIEARLRTVIPLDTLHTVTLVVDDTWDHLRDMEEACLILELHDRTRIIIPGSSTGFADLRTTLASQHALTTVVVA